MSSPSPAPTELHPLAVRLQQLRLARHPLGLTPVAARRLSSAISGGENLAGAFRSAEPRLAAVLEVAKPGDPLRAISDLVLGIGSAAAQRRTLQGAAAYPCALALCLAIAAVMIYGVAGPALSTLAALNRVVPVVSGGTGVVMAIAALVVLAATVYARVPSPLLMRADALIGRALALETAAALHGQGASLDVAFRAAAAWGPRGVKRGAEAMAQALVRGGSTAAARTFLSPEWSAIIMSAASRGIAAPVLTALARQARLECDRTIPVAVGRVHVASLLIAGAALLAIGVSFYGSYITVVVG
jgi:hypothetical protein